MFSTHKVSTRSRCEILDITPQVARAVEEAGIGEGLCLVFVPHTTAAVTINENADPDVKHDVLKKLTDLVPQAEAYYQHGEGNSDSHLKTALVGPSVTLIVHQGRLVLGTWQGVYFCEFDGPRSRTFHVKITGLPCAATQGSLEQHLPPAPGGTTPAGDLATHDMSAPVHASPTRPPVVEKRTPAASCEAASVGNLGLPTPSARKLRRPSSLFSPPSTSTTT